MSIITNFLKLIKPEKNDYVDVEEHISNNYDKIDTWARDLVINDLENGGVDKALSANQGLILDNKDKGIVGGYNGKFPLTSATKGNIYLLENTQKYYICITDYNGSELTTPNANFEELSVYTNRSKLDNLRRCQVDYIVESKTYTKGTVFNTDEILDNDIFIISVGLNSTERAYTAIHSIRKNIDTNNLVLSFFGSGNVNSPATVVFNIKKTINTIECTAVNGAASTYNYVTIIRYRF